MDTMTLDQREADPRDNEPLPRRPRRQFLNRRSAALAALVTCAVGFYAGVRVEKGQLSNSTTGLRLPTAAGAAGAAGAARAGGTRAGAGAAGAAGSVAGSARGGTRAGGFPGFAGGAAGGASASVRTVASVNGKTLVLTEVSGNTVKVRLTSSTKITKSEPVSRQAVRPGDAIVVQGAANKQGTTVAASLTDTGTSGAASGSSAGGSGAGGSGAGGSGSGGSRGGVGSLFSSGG